MPFTMFGFDEFGEEGFEARRKRATRARARKRAVRRAATPAGRAIPRIRLCGCELTRIRGRRAVRCPIPGRPQVGRKGFMYKFLGRGQAAPSCTTFPNIRVLRRRRGAPCQRKVRAAVWRHCRKVI